MMKQSVKADKAEHHEVVKVAVRASEGEATVRTGKD